MDASLQALRAAVRRVPRDVVLAAGLLIAAQLELLAVGPVPHQPVATIAAFGLTVPFIFWHRWPLLVLAAVMTSFLTQTSIGVPANAQVIGPVVWALASFGAAAFTSLRNALVGLLVVAVPVGALRVISDVVSNISDLLYALAVFTMVPWVTGRVYRARRAEALDYARRAAKAEAETERRATEVLEIERRRIARELHDIIAHSLSLMVLQAGAASEVLGRSPERAREAMTTVQDTGRQALAEMKRLLSVLRTSDSDAQLQPQPGLADLPSLVDHVRDTGLDVRLTMDLDGVQAPAAIELSVYRVVQESLTNVIKHAAAQHSEVDVRAGKDAIEVKITDDGPEATVRRTGHGLIGLRERVALYHGDFSAESGPGGFAVKARFPLDGAGRAA